MAGRPSPSRTRPRRKTTNPFAHPIPRLAPAPATCRPRFPSLGPAWSAFRRWQRETRARLSHPSAPASAWPIRNRAASPFRSGSPGYSPVSGRDAKCPAHAPLPAHWQSGSPTEWSPPPGAGLLAACRRCTPAPDSPARHRESDRYWDDSTPRWRALPVRTVERNSRAIP